MERTLTAANVTYRVLSLLEDLEEQFDMPLQVALDGLRDVCAITLLSEAIDPASFTSEVLVRVEEMRQTLHEKVAEDNVEPADA